MKNFSGKLKRLLTEVRALISEDEALSGEAVSFLYQVARFFVTAGRSFSRNRCPVRASALAYGSLLAMVPMLVVVVSVSSALLKSQGEQPVDNFVRWVVKQLTPEASTESGLLLPLKTDDASVTEAREEAVKRIKAAINNMHSGTLGIVGTAALVFVGISMLARIEETFNDIWGVTRGRSWFSRVVHYWGALTLGPLLLIVALGMTSGRSLSFTEKLVSATNVPGHIALDLALQFIPLALLCVAFALFYQTMPNTRVQWNAAFIGGLVGGTLWHLNNIFSVLYVSRVVTNSKIYGSLGMIPVFMVGLYFSWMILLFGAQVAYAWQNRDAYVQARVTESASQHDREFLALRIMTLVGQHFYAGTQPPTAVELSHVLAVPGKLVSLTAHALLQAQLLVEVLGTETRYAPARPIEKISVHDVFHAMRFGTGPALAMHDGPDREVVSIECERVEAAEREAAVKTTVASLVKVARAS